MKDGRTHLTHKAEHVVNLDRRAIVGVTVQPVADVVREVVGTGGTTAIRCWWFGRRSASAPPSWSPIAGGGAGAAGERPATPFIGIVCAFAGRGDDTCCATGASGWNAPLRICTRRPRCAESICGVSPTSRNVLVHTGGFNVGLPRRRLIGVGTPQGVRGRLAAVVRTLLVLVWRLWTAPTRIGRPEPRHSSLDDEATGRCQHAVTDLRMSVFTTDRWETEAASHRLSPGTEV